MKGATLVLCVGAVAAGCGSNWGERSSEHGGFRVEMPEPATVLYEQLSLPEGDVILEGYGSTAYRRPGWLFGRNGFAPLDSVSVMVECAPLPGMQASGDGRLLEGVVRQRREEAKTRGDALISQGSTSSPRCPGIESEEANDWVHSREWVCITPSRRLCVLKVIAPEAKIRGPEADRFLSSFRPS